MGLSNYPPGVTGNEIEIAGPDWEGEITRTCDATDVELQVLGEDARLLMVHTPTTHTWPPTAQRLMEATITVVVPECPFIDGEVYAWAYNGVLTWTCPVCGKEYSEDGRDD